MKQRPLGITIIAIIFLVVAVISLLWSLIVFGVGGITAVLGGVLGAENMAAFGNSNTMTGFLGIMAAVVQISAAVGLFLVKKWGWYLAVFAVGVSVIQGVIGLGGGELFSFLCGGLLLLIPLGIFLYLLSGGIRKLFGVI